MPPGRIKTQVFWAATHARLLFGTEKEGHEWHVKCVPVCQSERLPELGFPEVHGVGVDCHRRNALAVVIFEVVGERQVCGGADPVRPHFNAAYVRRDKEPSAGRKQAVDGDLYMRQFMIVCLPDRVRSAGQFRHVLTVDEGLDRQPERPNLE